MIEWVENSRYTGNGKLSKPEFIKKKKSMSWHHMKKHLTVGIQVGVNEKKLTFGSKPRKQRKN